MTATNAVLKSIPRGSDLLASLPRLAAGLPISVNFDDDVWNLASLQRQAKTRTFNVDFRKICSSDLRLLAKIRVAESIVFKKTAGAVANMTCTSLAVLAEAIQARPIGTLTSDDFCRAEAMIRERSPKLLGRLPPILHVTAFGLTCTSDCI